MKANNMNFNNVIGNKIKTVHANADHLSLELENGTILDYTVLGDCCSSSYFYEITGVEKIINKTITSITEIDEKDADEADKFPNEDCVSVYGYRFSADPSMTDIKGVGEMETSNSMLVVFRNDSNGYYDGSLDKPSEVPEPIGDLVTDNWKVKM